jgi:hypothetical protein
VWSYTSTPPYFFVAWCLVKYRDNFTFTVGKVTFFGTVAKQGREWMAPFKEEKRGKVVNLPLKRQIVNGLFICSYLLTYCGKLQILSLVIIQSMLGLSLSP